MNLVFDKNNLIIEFTILLYQEEEGLIVLWMIMVNGDGLEHNLQLKKLTKLSNSILDG